MNALVLDGALGTQLESIIPPDSPLQIKLNRLWLTQVLLKEPQLIQQIHEKYVNSGADIITTSTYQASRDTLKKYCNFGDLQVYDIWDKSIELAYQAGKLTSRNVFVGGSIGPYGGFLANGSEYTGEYRSAISKTITDYHLPMIYYFNRHKKVDLIMLETIPSFEEVKVIISILKHLNNLKYFSISLSMKSTTELADGTSIQEVVKYLDKQLDQSLKLREKLVSVGCNCVDFQLVEGIFEQFNKLAYELPLITYPNLGFGDYYLLGTDYSHLSNTEKWAQLVKKWLTFKNIRIVGGCCSTGPTEIGIIRNLINK